MLPPQILFREDLNVGGSQGCDIILRSSRSVLELTVDLYSAWQGELVYKNLPIKQIK